VTFALGVFDSLWRRQVLYNHLNLDGLALKARAKAGYKLNEILRSNIFSFNISKREKIKSKNPIVDY